MCDVLGCCCCLFYFYIYLIFFLVAFAILLILGPKQSSAYIILEMQYFTNAIKWI